MSNKTSGLSLASLNVVKSCEQGFEFEHIDANGYETGVFITVIGANAPQLQKTANSKYNQRRQQEAMLTKRGKDIPTRLIEEDIELGNELIAKRITGWRGISDDGVEWPYSEQNAILLCEINPLIVEQVRTHSENMANFTLSK
jgi:hypothetical protein